MSTTTRKTNIALWTAQGILAALFIFAGGYKLATASATLAQMTPFSPLFLKFIGACEVAGGLGLVLPGIFRVHTGLTPLAAVGLTIIMTGAVVTTILAVGLAAAILPCVVGIVAATIARGRRSWAAPTRGATPLARLQTARGH